MLLAITVISLGFAVAMSVVAWRTVQGERRRSLARVAALAADIHGYPEPAGPASASGPSLAGESMFHPVSAKTPSLTTVGTAALGIFAVCALAALAVFSLSPRGRVSPSVVSRDAGTVAMAGRPVPASSTALVGTGALELVALEHDRADDRLTVRGVVRNPSSGASIDHLAAVVLLFDANGGFISSARAGVGADAFKPGSETTFSVTVPNAAGVDRYRVSFRSENRVVPHVDRRS